MSYEPYYPGGWQSGQSGGTPITPEALNHIEEGIMNSAPAMESTGYPGCYYRTVDGVTEWLNPPIEVGVEYRTTERNGGKPVYTQLVNCGTLAHGGSVPLGVSNIIRFAAYATNGTVYPFQTPDSAYWRQVIIQGSNLIMLCGSAAVGADTVYCQIWYTED